jgi:hypothetical protein
MRATSMLFLIAVGVFASAFGAHQLFVPDVVAISVTEVTQPLWALELAFLLRATENIAALGAILVLAAATVQWFTRRCAV